jgi:hypothetical protein
MCNIEMHLIIIEHAKLHIQIVSLAYYLTRGVSHYGLAIYIKKYLKAKEELYGDSNISPCKNIIFQKNPLKETKILQDIIITL